MNYQTVPLERFPLLARRGGCGINKKSRSHRSAADGVSSSGNGQLDVFTLGTDGLWHQSLNGTTWSGWQSLCGMFTAKPAAVSLSPNRIDLLERDLTNALTHGVYTPQR